MAWIGARNAQHLEMKESWREIFLSTSQRQRVRRGSEEAECEPHLTVTALREGADVRGAGGHSQLPSSKVAVFEFQHVVVQLAGEQKDTQTCPT